MSTAERTETRLPEALVREEGGAFVTWPQSRRSQRRPREPALARRA